MAGASFQTNPIDLHRLLDECHRGIIQLPDFQRSWVWDEDRIKSLIASISRAFPVGALMSLDTGGPVNFKPRPVEGAPAEARQKAPQSLLLDGQQRMTSLYQVTLRGKVVETVTPKRKRVKRWFYIDIAKAIDETVDREETVFGVPEDRIERTDFGREVTLDLSTPEKEYAALMFPVGQVFDWDTWQDGFNDHWSGEEHKAVREQFRTFKKEVLENFKMYRVPVIALDRSTSKEAVCVVFEKVNTGGKPLDAFELVTAMYAASGHELRKDWYGDEGVKGRYQRLADTLRPADSDAGILAGVGNTDFLQAISLFFTRDRRRAAEQAGKEGKELPAVSGNRKALLDLPLEAYKKYEAQVERGFVQAAKFLHMLHIYRIFDLPYQSQIVPLAAILADIGDAWEHEAIRAKLIQWYWNGVFGELYGSAVETRIAKDFTEVPRWLSGGPEPSTVSETIFRSDRLKTMRMRLHERLTDEGRRAGLPFGPEVRPYGVLRRERGYSPHLPAGLVQDGGHQAYRVRFHHQQDSLVVSHEQDHRRRCAKRISGETGKRKQLHAANRQRKAGQLSAIAPHRSRPSPRRQVRGVHGRSAKTPAWSDRTGDGQGRL